MPDEQQRAFVASRLASIIVDGLASVEASDGLRLITDAELHEIKVSEYQRGYAAGADALTEPRPFNAD